MSEFHLAPPARLNRQGSLNERFDSDRDLMTHAGPEQGHYEKDYRAGLATNPRKRRWIWAALLALLVVIGLAVGLGVGLTVGKKNSNASKAGAGSDGNGDTASTEPPPKADPSTPVTNTTDPVRGGSGETGSEVTTDLNVTFTYVNDFGGRWAYDPDTPFNVSAFALVAHEQPQGGAGDGSILKRTAR